MPSSTTASQEELKTHRVPIQWRDGCSALLIPLNVCRRKTLYMPWECDHERHAYEKCVSCHFRSAFPDSYPIFAYRCQYEDYVRRMKEATKLKKAAAEAA
ncbi:NADH-ubiquinone oxidoreductase B18 subunit-domain-containing protein [Mycena olivaceomarginata]|nr:NADH-ubiquinone oxidoreductase B18 subunit-domain-containing protein [Mycena olivaceomarginata]